MTSKRWIRIGWAALAALTVLSFVKSLFISLDIDESYMAALSWRLVSGDRLFVDLWEPHQLSAWLGAVFLKLWYMLTGSVDYSILFLRFVSVLIHTGLGVILYRQLRKELAAPACMLILFLHLNFLPKWVQSTEFELMHYWFLLGVFLFLNQYFTSDRYRLWLTAGGGLCLVGSMTVYPTMIILYPFYAAGIYVLEGQFHQRHGKKALPGVLTFTLGSLIPGLALLAYIFSYMTLSEFLTAVRHISQDQHYLEVSFTQRLLINIRDLLSMTRNYLIYILIAVLLTLFVCAFLKYHQKKSVSWQGFWISVFLIAATELCVVQLYGCLFQDQNQFYFQARFAAIIFPAFCLAIRHHRQLGKWLYLCILPGIISFPAVIVMTDMGVNVTTAKMFIAVLGSLIVYEEYAEKILPEKTMQCLVRGLQRTLSFFLLAGFFICRLVLIRITGCGEFTVMAPLVRMESGAAEGIYVLTKTASVWNQNNQELEQYLEEGDQLLYIGAETLIYVRSGITAASPSTISTPVFGEYFLEYYEEYPEKLPTVIVVDKTFETTPEYNYSPENAVILNWIAENYADAEVIETDYMIIYRADS